ncbi:MAG: S8 family serine peptidase [Actinobacteria bacterium]|nr:S8 family serine peptidase [Actinomycetota bacterium]
MLGRSRRAPSLLALAPLVAVVLVLGLLAPAASAELPALPLTSSTALSPELEALATPAVRSRSLAGQAEALGLPTEGAGRLVRDGGRVVVEAHFEAGAAAAVETVKATGAEVLNVSRRYQTLVLSVAPAELHALAAVPGVAGVTPSLAPELAGLSGGGAQTAAIASNGLCEGGSVISQGVAQLNLPAARAAFGARGAGETIGVISNSFNSATTTEAGAPIPTKAHEDEVTNDLPGPASTCSGQEVPVNVVAEDPIDAESPPTDEGRAMLQAVHDLAPHAKLAFATGEPAEISYAENIEKLAAPVSQGGAGADVIVDDLAFPTEPFFQEGPVAGAIRRVTEKGVLYFAAAGNDNLINAAGQDISSWEAPVFRGKPTCNSEVDALLTAALAEEGLGPYEPDCMDFDPGAGVDTEFGITVEPGASLSLNLQWAEPRFGVKTALFGFLLSDVGGTEEIADVSGSTEPPEKPFIGLDWKNPTATSQTVRLVIARCSGANCNPNASATADPPIKFAITNDGAGVSEIEYPESAEGDTVGPAIYGHRGSPFVTTVAAVNFQESSTAPQRPEPYSSRGPVVHYYGPVDGVKPAAPLGAPQTIQKPDITATDCASNTFFGILAGDGRHFCGSSQAAEHAATVAALMRQTAPLASRVSLLSALETSATKFTTVASPDAVGAGMVNAFAAMTKLGGSPVEDPPSHVVPSPEEEAKAGPPTVRITNGPGALSSQNRPTFEFTSNRPVAFTCQLDGGASQPCASPFVVPAKLADGDHGFVVVGKDAQGRSGSSGVYAFGVDTKAPRTKIVGHPKKVVRTHKRSVVAHFRLQASESPVTYYCQFDKEPLRICPARFKHRFKQGRHAVRIRAKDQVGNIAAKPTVFHFRVKELSPRRPAKK